MTSQPVIVIGDGWAALAAVAFLAKAETQVCWIAGTGSRLLPPLAGMEEGRGAALWVQLAESYGVSVGEVQRGSFLREFRNKSWKEPSWSRIEDPSLRVQEMEGSLWEPERAFVLQNEVRLQKTLLEIEQELRRVLLSGEIAGVKRREGLPVSGLLIEEGSIRGVKLGSGEEIDSDRVIYADRWNVLPTLENIPKPLSFMRRRGPMGILQASFVHQPPLQEGVLESFFASMHKESGEKIERHFWGYVSSEGQRSVWTLCLSPEEGEDNHEIAKKFRRLKSGLDKFFAGSDLIPSSHETFTSTLSEEQIRFEEEVLFSEGGPLTAPVALPQVSGLSILTDAYGPSCALEQVGAALGVQEWGPNSQSKGVDVSHAPALE
jgi:hypothetical protein